MAADNIKIEITKYDWSGSAAIPAEASIYSGNEYVETAAPFDNGMDYMIDDSLPITWNFEYLKNPYDSPKLLPMGAQVSLLFTNSDGVIANFFRIGFPTGLIKWKIKIFYDNVLVHEGWIAPDGLQYGENFGKGKDTHSVIARVKDVLTEIRDYFVTQRLISNNEINWTGTHAPTGTRTAKFSEVVAQNFPGVIFSMPDSIASWDVMETPQIYFPPGVNINIEPFMWLTGYERAYTAEENRWDWLRRILNDMGFVMYSFVENGDLKIGIKDRAGSTLPHFNVNIDNMLEYIKSKELDNSNYDAVILINGTMDGGDQPFELQGNYYSFLKGARLIIISNTFEDNFEVKHWDRAQRFGNGNIKFYWLNHKLYKYASEDNNEFRIYKITGTNNNVVAELIRIPLDKILKLDGGSPNPYAMKFDTNNGSNTGHTIGAQPDPLHQDMVFMGGYGEMLTKDGMGYSDYVKTGQFRANFEPFLQNMERETCRYSQDKLLLSPNYTITGSGPLFGKTWDISYMEIDLINETTAFDLIANKFQLAP